MITELILLLFIFFLTVAISYAIWRKMYVPIKKNMGSPNNSKPNENKNKMICELNEIMGYDFIQIKTMNEEEYAHKPQDNKIIEDVIQTRLYATASVDDTETIEPSVEPEQPVILNATDEDIIQMMNFPWPESNDSGLQTLAEGLYDKYDIDESDASIIEENEYDEQDEALKQYMEHMYENLELSITEEDRNGVEELMKTLTENDSDNEN